ncbi:hypothetical protein D3C73_1258760 [compost metagenome]
MFIHLQGVVVDKTGVAANFVGRRDLIDTFQHEADETVAFAFNSVHHFTTVNGGFTGGIYAKAWRTLDLMHRLGGSNQQF